MTTNYKYPLAISGEVEELKALIPKLKKLGYKTYAISNWKHCPILVNNYRGDLGLLSNLAESDKYERNRISVSLADLSPECILAIAAVREDGEYQPGEYVRWLGNKPCIGKIVAKDGFDNCYALDVNGNLKSYDSCHKDYLERLNMEEIISYFKGKEAHPIVKKDNKMAAVECIKLLIEANQVSKEELFPEKDKEYDHTYSNVILITEDNLSITDPEQLVYGIIDKWNKNERKAKNCQKGKLWFSTVAAREEYIIINKPCMSFSEIKEWKLSNNNSLEHLLFKVKQKLNDSAK